MEQRAGGALQCQQFLNQFIMMKRTLLFSLGMLLLNGAFGQSEKWKLVWSDEFNYTGLPDYCFQRLGRRLQSRMHLCITERQETEKKIWLFNAHLDNVGVTAGARVLS